MVGTVHDDDVRARERLTQSVERGRGAVRVATSGDHEDRGHAVGHARQGSIFLDAERRRDERKRDIAPAGGDAPRDGRTEGVPGNAEAAGRRQPPLEMAEGGLDVLLFRLTVAVGPAGLADAAEVEPEGAESRCSPHLGRPGHDWVLHVAAVEGVGVADHDPSRSVFG